MNILLVLEGTFPWYRGGVSEWVNQYIKHCSDYSFTILQVATDPFLHSDPNQALYLLPDNIVWFERIPPPDISHHWEQSFKGWLEQYQHRINSFLFSQDIIHVANTGFAGWLGKELSNISKKPLMLTEHAIYWLEVEKGAVALECGYKVPDNEAQALIIDVFKAIASDLYSSANTIISVSKHNIDFQKELGSDEVLYIPNGINKDWIESTKKQNEVPVIGWVGRCAEMKNPRQIYEYADAFRKSDIRISFLVLLSDAGENSLAGEMKARSEEYPEVKLVWNQPSEQYFKEMDMLLITSHNESQPLVMLEALAKKVLPVGRQVGDFTREFGLAFDPQTGIEEIVSKIIAFWRDSAGFGKYVDERVSRISQFHTWESIFSSYKTLLNRQVVVTDETLK